MLEVCVADGEGVRRTIGAGPLKEPKCERARTNIMRVSVSVVYGTGNRSGSDRCYLLIVRLELGILLALVCIGTAGAKCGLLIIYI